MSGNFYSYALTQATGVSVSTHVDLPDRPALWSIVIPSMTAWCTTATCNVRLEGALEGTTTFFPITYSNNPATSTSGARAWEAATDLDRQWVICEAAQFAPRVRVKTTQLTSNAVTFYLVGKLI